MNFHELEEEVEESENSCQIIEEDDDFNQFIKKYNLQVPRFSYLLIKAFLKT